jgi:phosphoglucomutase
VEPQRGPLCPIVRYPRLGCLNDDQDGCLHAFTDQKPGTSGLRKKTPAFMKPHYLQNFIQATFDAIGGAKDKTFVLGGDGRYFGDTAAQIILKMAAANGAARVIVGQGAILSTPAASHLIRLHGTDGGIIMSASHNPGGPEEDFGVKFNTPNGGPAPEAVTEAIFAATKGLTEYHILDAADIDLNRIGRVTLGDMAVDVVDPVADYATLMESLFDFPAIAAMFAGGFRMRLRCDACAVTGPLRHRDSGDAGWARPPGRCERHAAARFRRDAPGPEPRPGPMP